MSLGLVFAGGGGKGAYEIGVWKAFKEYGIDKNIKAISGTSVGGLNGALFAKGNFEQGLKVWQEMSPDKILQISPKNVASNLSKLNVPAIILTNLTDKLNSFKSEGIFNQKGLESIIKDSLSPKDLEDAIPLYICATDVSNRTAWEPLYKKLNDLSYETIVQYLLATSAIPGAFSTTIVENTKLVDGFLTDNTPAKPLIEIEKCDKVIVVLLGRSENILELKQKHQDVSFWEIVPSGDTKESLGSLNFKAESATALIEMCYQDTTKILKNLYEFMLIEQKFIEKGETLRIQDDGFKKHISNNSLLRSEYKQLSDSVNDMSSLQYLLSNPRKQKSIDNSATNKSTLDSVSKELETSLNSHDMTLIENSLDEILDDMGKNSKEMATFAFDAVTSLASNDGKINYQINQGRFSRMLGTITGSDHKLQADVNLNFSKAIYANTQMIKKLAERNNLTLDMCISLGNKVNFLSQNQNVLQMQNNQQMQMLGGLRNAIFTLADVTKNAIQENTARIEELEYGQALLNWSHHLKSSIQGLNEYESIIKVISTYQNVVKNSKDEENTHFLYSALINLDFNEISINPSAFIEHCIDNKESSLIKNNFLPIPKSHEVYNPIFTSVVKVNETPSITLDKVLSHTENKYNLNLDIDINAIDFSFELLNGFKLSNELRSSLDLAKESMLDKLDTLSNTLQKDEITLFEKEIQTLRENITKFKVIVPIIGKFSSGKSKLLNQYISPENAILEVDTNPMTAIPCEIQYSSQNIVKFYDKDGNESVINTLKVGKQDNDKYVFTQYFINSAKLKNRKDLTIVDMPGFESSNLNHNNAINRYFNKGHHYILALSCESVNDNSILKHIREILSYGATFSVVITKADKKLPKDIDSLVKVLRENIARKHPNVAFDVAITSANKHRIEEFETIIDTIYADSTSIFEKNFHPFVANLKEEVLKHYTTLLNAPSSTAEYEKRERESKEVLEQETKKLHHKLKEIEFFITSDGYIKIIDKITNVLNANITALVGSAKQNNLHITITEMLRTPLNSLFKGLSEEAFSRLEDKDTHSAMMDLNISFTQTPVNIELSLWGSIKDFFFDTQSKELKKEIENNVIPTVLNDMATNVKSDLQNLYNNISHIVEEKINAEKQKANETKQEIQKQMQMQEKEFEEIQEQYKNSLENIQGL